MVEEFPGNSKKDKERGRPQRLPEKKVERVTQSEVRRRKKPLGKRVREFFFGGSDARSVGEFIAQSIVLPAMQDMFSEAVHEGFDRMIFGEGRDSRRRSGRYRDPRGHVRYDRFSRDEPRTMSRRSRASHNFDEIVIDSRVEAEHVLDRLFDLVNQFEVASVADLYELVGISGNYTDEKWGWDDLRGAGVTRLSSGGYLLDLPRPEPLD